MVYFNIIDELTMISFWMKFSWDISRTTKCHLQNKACIESVCQIQTHICTFQSFFLSMTLQSCTEASLWRIRVLHSECHNFLHSYTLCIYGFTVIVIQVLWTITKNLSFIFGFIHWWTFIFLHIYTLCIYGFMVWRKLKGIMAEFI